MRQIRRTLGLALAATLGAATAAYGQASITPGSVDATIDVGETITISKTITLGPAGATTVDLFFLIDDTGSMGGVINAAKAGAGAILGALPASYRFGVSSYDGDPVEGVPANLAYNNHQALTFDKTAAQAGINNIFASGGGDFPEANFFALEQLANTAGWRPEAQRLVIWFGDAPSHTATTSQAEAIAALVAADAKVIAFNNAFANQGIDQDGQASAVVAAAGGVLVHDFDNPATDFVTTVNDQIEAATTIVDLIFGSSFMGTGLSLAFTCTDALGCDDVEAGESRTFDLAITGLEPGTYSFTVFAQGIDAFETDRITVTGTAVTPEPISLILLGTGLAGIGAVGRRRRKSEVIA